MDFIDVGFILVGIVITLARLNLNAQIYRSRYNSDIKMDYTETGFPEDRGKREEASILFLLSLFTFFWINFDRENRIKIIWSNALFLLFVMVMVVYFNYYY